MSERERWKVQARNIWKRFRRTPSSHYLNDSSHHGSVASAKSSAKDRSSMDEVPQYRLRSSTPKRRWCRRAVGAKQQLSDIKPNERLASVLHWMFRASFLLLFSVMCLYFFALITIFAGFIIAASRLNSDCVRAGKKKKPVARNAMSKCVSLLFFQTYHRVGLHCESRVLV